MSTRLLPVVLRRFVSAFPDVDVELAEALHDLDFLRSLERGVLDLAFVDLPLPAGPFETTPILSDPYVLVAQPAPSRRGCARRRRLPTWRGCR